ncbi:ZmpA/ZmpB/ZmpC family metallo-endopeptidase [Streptococcus sp. DTU_2020_1000888_1_SI_GRL_NUU_041A]|uniref:ZmpA/ZmpB/ZmpC family metallo-endopeptidase n=1 Tax=Streptococcus sp. DTU_2020_1000888_1_SI_GRL_NUU_041A TaxID=3077723 RepID=UPI0028EB5570|nr:ZmpA/ZmpB/ZmpC family metallo-endopeptidase [Streptococcus sp. DTU_2020_1000888_1_SI_GRL_NUU_041A]WNU95939.1 ZmpA/ZmpB/ZmpC family metallo-endopeptidase [Streptococcus sp. DTU_2020_1000888_1_SI_GRL_NUU_041A]
MKKFFGEKQTRFAFRKLAVGLVSAAISSLFFVSIVGVDSVQAQEKLNVHYKYVTDTEITPQEKDLIVSGFPKMSEGNEEAYYLVYRLNSNAGAKTLPNTGDNNNSNTMMTAGLLTTIGLVVFSVSKRKVQSKFLLTVLVGAGVGGGLILSVDALENGILLQYNAEYQVSAGESLPSPSEISGYTYVGYIKDESIKKLLGNKILDNQQNANLDKETLNQNKKLDYSLSFDKNALKNHTLGVNTIEPQDEVLSGRVAKPELLYKEETVETEIAFGEQIQENPDLAEGTVKVKQEGKTGRKIEVVRIFTVDNAEVSREVLSTKIEEATPQIVEKGTKKLESPNEKPVASNLVQPEQVAPLPEYTGVQAGAIVDPEQVPSLPEYTGALSGAIVEPEQIEPEIGGVQSGAIVEPEQVTSLPEYTGVQSGAVVAPEQVTSLPEYTGTQAGAVVSPEQVTPLPEYTEVQAGAVVEPEQVAPLPEYTGTQSGAIVEPEQVTPLPEYTGVQAGAIVEPEQVEPPQEYTGNIEPAAPEAENPAEKAQEPKEQKQEPEKHVELRNVSELELYSLTDGKYKQHVSLDTIPSNQDNYFVKVKSSKFKDVFLPISSIVDSTKDGQPVYKITASAEKLKQDIDNKYEDNYTFYLAKKAEKEVTNFTSFSNLVQAINNDLNGTYYLGASLNANEIELENGASSYINGTFTGKLIGSKDGKNYAIYNLKKPLFNTLSAATVENLTLKDVNISGKSDIGALANEANNATRINNVHVDGVLAGERGIGGLVWKADNSKITNSSFKGRIINSYETKAPYNIGGLVGQLTGINALVDKSKATIAISSNADSTNQTVGGLAGLVEKDALISNSYAEGDINNVKRFGSVAGVAGYLWDKDSNEESRAGRLHNVLSDVNVMNGNAISGYHYRGMRITDSYSNKDNRVYKVTLEKDEVVTKESLEERGTILDVSQIASKKSEINSLSVPAVENLLTSSNKESDFSKIEDYQASRALAYKNIEKLLPFYNKATIVKYGNLVKEDSALYEKEVLSAVMMKDNEVITDVASHKEVANKLLLHYKDHSSEKLDLIYQSDFSKLAEYRVGDTGLIYTPNQFLQNHSSIVNEVLPDLRAVDYQSESIRNTLGISSGVSLTELYLEEQFAKTKENLANTLEKLLFADAVIAGENQTINGYVVDKIKRNKEALLLGLTYLERWYNFNYGDVNIKDLVMYHMDFFGKGNVSPLDTIIELGKSGFNNLLAKNNVDAYSISLANNNATKDLFSTLANYREVFLPNKTNNQWFKEQTKAYIVEEKSAIDEVRVKQEQAGSKYSIGVYDRITSDTWKYRNMVLPLLTMPERSVFVISTISSLGFGAYDRYRNNEHRAGAELNKFVEDNAQETAKRQRDHYDYWYRILDEQSREKLYRNILLYDAYKFGDDATVGKATAEAQFDSSNPAMKYFFGPVGNKVVHNKHGAYATGDSVYYMGYRMLDKDGAITYTHEMTHDSDNEIYLGGYGRRSGLGPEFFAKGLLQAPDHPDDATITVNSILKYDKNDASEKSRLQVLDPTKRFQNADDLKNYVHNMFDVIYMLEYLEGMSVVNRLSDVQKVNALRKVENKYVRDADGNDVYATNVIKNITMADAQKLNSFDSLIENDIVSAREYKNGDVERNGYHTIKLFSPIYSALSSEKGTPGDLMGRRMAYELLAAKGFKDGMVPYISNQYEDDAKQNGKTISIYGKTRGLVTDDLVLRKVFNGQFHNWTEFKKAMYEERKNKFDSLNKVTFDDTRQPWTSYATKTISTVEELQALMDEAVLKDANDNWYSWSGYKPEHDSAVHKLKKAVFKAYLDQTDDFRKSIFENQK